MGTYDKFGPILTPANLSRRGRILGSQSNIFKMDTQLIFGSHQCSRAQHRMAAIYTVSNAFIPTDMFNLK